MSFRKSSVYTTHNPPMTVTEAVGYAISPYSFYGEGRLEELAGRTANHEEMFGRFVELLHKKGVLSSEDVVTLCAGHVAYEEDQT